MRSSFGSLLNAWSTAHLRRSSWMPVVWYASSTWKWRITAVRGPRVSLLVGFVAGCVASMAMRPTKTWPESMIQKPEAGFFE